MMPARQTDLWNLALGRPQVDPNDLARAVEAEAAHESLDYRTRLLIRDSVDALRDYWGEESVSAWLTRCQLGSRIESICSEEFERPGFPTLASRLMDKTRVEEMKEYLRELGTSVQRPLRVFVDSAALILQGYISRRTDDVDIIDEVAPELRSQHQLLARLKSRYGLMLGHVQSHYFPSGWESRAHSIEPLGRLQVHLLDVYDVCASKLFSKRDKDLDDLRLLKPQLDKDLFARRLKEHCSGFLTNDAMKAIGEKNWYILYGEPLPS
jgi:hypothetical protein